MSAVQFNRRSDDLEREYRDYRIAATIQPMRLSLLLFLAVYGTYFMLDILASQILEPIYPLAFMVGAGTLALYGATFLTVLRPYVPHMAVFSVLATGIGLAWLSAWGKHHDVPVPWEALVIHFLYNFFLVGQRFHRALLVSGTLILTVYMVVFRDQLEGSVLYEQAFFLAIFVTLGTFGNVLQERYDRTAWCHSRELRDAASRDSLTKLTNHGAFMGRAEAQLAQAQQDGKTMAVFMLDVDEFKSYNDEFGHQAGDDVLRRVADVVGGFARRGSDVAARLGGEEFALLLDDCPPARCGERAEALRHAVFGLGILHPHSLAGVLTVSIGVAHAIPGRQQPLKELLAHADDALYKAKQLGRNRCYIYEDEAAVI